MPKPFLIEDWTTVRGAPGEVITQTFDRYAQLGGFVDVIFYVECSYESNTPTLSFQTSPVADDSYFAPMVTRVLAASSTITQDKVLFASASVPLSHFVRWSITDASAFAATFRVWAVARPG